MQNYLLCMPSMWTQQSADHMLPYLNSINCASLHQKDIQIANLIKRLQQLTEENMELRQKLNRQMLKTKNIQKKSVKRRTENQLRKCYGCPYQKCKKQYASNLALNLHIKIKHNGGTKKQRDLVAKKMVEAQKIGSEIPLNSLSCINLPPNYIDEYKKQNSMKKKLKNLKFSSEKQINSQE